MRLAGRHAARRWIGEVHCQLVALGKECERRNPVAEAATCAGKPEPNFRLDKAYGPVGAIRVQTRLIASVALSAFAGGALTQGLAGPLVPVGSGAPVPRHPQIGQVDIGGRVDPEVDVAGEPAGAAKFLGEHGHGAGEAFDVGPEPGHPPFPVRHQDPLGPRAAAGAPDVGGAPPVRPRPVAVQVTEPPQLHPR